jgi:hypothetical protein
MGEVAGGNCEHVALIAKLDWVSGRRWLLLSVRELCSAWEDCIPGDSISWEVLSTPGPALQQELYLWALFFPGALATLPSVEASQEFPCLL